MISSKQIPISKACYHLNISRQAHYKWQHRITNGLDSPMISEIHDIAPEFPKYGYRRITVELHRRGQAVNHKKVLGIMHEKTSYASLRRSLGLQQQIQTRNIQHTLI